MFSFPPVSGADYADIFAPNGKPYRNDALSVIADAEKPFFLAGVLFVLQYDAMLIKKRHLRRFERDMVLFHIPGVLSLVPFECHTYKYMYESPYCQDASRPLDLRHLIPGNHGWSFAKQNSEANAP